MCMHNFGRLGGAKHIFFCVHINICRVMLNVFLFIIPILIVSVRSTLLVTDNKVWIELMHFALKYYSILTWCNEQVNERVNVRLVKIKRECVVCLRKAGTWMTTAEQRVAKWVLYSFVTELALHDFYFIFSTLLGLSSDCFFVFCFFKSVTVR